MVGSLESDSIVTISGSGQATEEIVMISLAGASDSSVDMSVSVVLFLGGLCSLDDYSTRKRQNQ